MKGEQPVNEPVGRFIDIFAGCGGLSLGLINAGWRGKFAVEKHPHAFSTLKHNLIDSQNCGYHSWPRWLPRQNHDIKELNKDYEKQFAQYARRKACCWGSTVPRFFHGR